MIVSENTIKAEGLGSFFKNLGKISSKAGKKLANNVLKNPGRALEIGANIATAAATKSPKAALSTLPEVINFYCSRTMSTINAITITFKFLKAHLIY